MNVVKLLLKIRRNKEKLNKKEIEYIKNNWKYIGCTTDGVINGDIVDYEYNYQFYEFISSKNLKRTIMIQNWMLL